MARGAATASGSNRGKKASTSSSSTAEAAVPEDVPSLVDIKRALPQHCFQSSLARSMYYVAKDLIIVSFLLSFLLLAESHSRILYLFLLPFYWYLQGTMMWALFVLGHDCGHGSFSSSTLANDVVGNLVHSLILVPYYPWKMSHRHHHKNTGNFDRDEIFYPVRERDHNGKAFIPLFGLGISWFYYLVIGYAPRQANHLNPFDPLFVKKAVQCSISLALCGGLVAFVLVPFASEHGFCRLASLYLCPVMVFATWLVITTFLHHQDEGVPWYADKRWDFVRGQLSSVDRDYGWAHGLVHNIGTHQIHHLFTRIPHYHLEEATEAFRERFPHLVRKSDERILSAFCKMFFLFNEQQVIDDDTEVHVFGRKEQ